MSKNNKSIKYTIPGHAIGSKVVKTKRHYNGDITGAIQHWKKLLKESGNLQILKDKKEFVKPSIIKRNQLSKAKYIQKIKDLD
jgi:hypothetical protein